MPHVHFYTGTDKKFEYIIIFCLYIMSRRATEFGYIMKIHKITLNIKQPLYLAGFFLGHIKSLNTLSFTVSVRYARFYIKHSTHCIGHRFL